MKTFRAAPTACLAFIALSVVAAPLGAQRVGTGAEIASLDAFLRVLKRGDQDALQRYIGRHFDPEALRAASAEERADRLARLYVDSGGFVVTKRIGTSTESEIAAARARFTGLPYCLTLKSRDAAGRRLISDFTAADLPLPASSRMRTPQPQEVARTMTRFMDRLARVGTFSGVFLIARDGRSFVRKAYGAADLAGSPVGPDTRFNIASIGKSITAVLIAQLVDERRLSYDDKVGKFLPDYPDKEVREKVTVRHLLTHSSGLGDKSEFTNSPYWAAQRSRLQTIDDYLPLIAGHRLESEPGTKYSYSNAGFVILGKIIERATGTDFYTAVAARVFERAGMTNSFYGHPREHGNVAKGLTNFQFVGTDYVFRLGAKRDATAEGPAKGGSHGGAYVTADDLLKFINGVRAGKLTSPETARMLVTAQASGRLDDMRNGFGFEIMSQNGHTVVGHGGGDIGVSAFVYHFNETGYTAIVLSNYDPRAIRVIARKLRGLLTRSVIGTPAPAARTDCTG